MASDRSWPYGAAAELSVSAIWGLSPQWHREPRLSSSGRTGTGSVVSRPNSVRHWGRPARPVRNWSLGASNPILMFRRCRRPPYPILWWPSWLKATGTNCLLVSIRIKPLATRQPVFVQPVHVVGVCTSSATDAGRSHMGDGAQWAASARKPLLVDSTPRMSAMSSLQRVSMVPARCMGTSPR